MPAVDQGRSSDCCSSGPGLNLSSVLSDLLPLRADGLESEQLRRKLYTNGALSPAAIAALQQPYVVMCSQRDDIWLKLEDVQWQHHINLRRAATLFDSCYSEVWGAESAGYSACGGAGAVQGM